MKNKKQYKYTVSARYEDIDPILKEAFLSYLRTFLDRTKLVERYDEDKKETHLIIRWNHDPINLK